MKLVSLNDGGVTSTGTVTCKSGIVGGVLVTADGSNDVTVILRKDDSSGTQVFDVVTKSPGFFVAPVDIGSQTLYYSVSGSGGAIQLYEWVQ